MFSRSPTTCGWAALLVIGSLYACSSDKPDDEREEMTMTAGQPAMMLPPIMVDNANEAGSTAAGSDGSTAGSSGSAGRTAGSSGSAGSSAGSGGSAGSAAGSGGSAGSSAGSGGSSTDAGVPEEEDPFGLFTPSCEGLICLEDADCASLYPDENATCKFTSCVDFFCQ